MSFSKAVLPSDWHLPKAGVRCFQFHQCPYCGHRLPTFEFRNLFGPWNPDELALAIQGMVNMVECSTCENQFSFNGPVLIHSPDHQRQLFVHGNKMTIPETDRMRTLIEALMREELARCGLTSEMPTQDVTMMGYLKEALQIPRESVATDRLAMDWRMKRLRHDPQARIPLLLDQIEQAALLAIARHEHLFDAGGEPPEVPVDLVYYSTYYEQSEMGWEAVRAALLEYTPSADARLDIRPLCVRFVEWFGENSRLRIEDHPHHTVELEDRFFEYLRSLPDLSSVASFDDPEHGQLRESWIRAIRHASISRNPGFALDLAEYYIRHIDLDHLYMADVEAMICFGALLLEVQNRRGEEPLPYLHLAAHALDTWPQELNEHGTMLAASAHEYAGRARVEGGNLREALDHFLAAIPLWRRIERTDGLGNAIHMAFALAATLQDAEAMRSLEADPLFKEISEPSQVPDNVQSNGVSTIREGPQLTRVNHVLVEDLDGDLAEGHLHIGLKPINFDPMSGDIPPDALAEGDMFFPYEEGLWRRMSAAPAGQGLPIMVLRHAQRAAGALNILEEQIKRHPILDWIEEARGTPQGSQREEIGMALLWMWATKNECPKWLEQEYGRLRTMHGENVFAWPLSTRTGLAAAMEHAALLEDDLPEQLRLTMANWGIGLLAHLVGPSAQRVIPSRLSPMAVFETRTRLGRLLEFVGSLRLAEITYEKNLLDGFRIRQADETQDHREAVQDLIGAEAERLNRTRIRQAEQPDPALCEKIFKTIEMVRARLLTDRIEAAMASTGVPSAGGGSYASPPSQLHYAQLSLAQGIGQYQGCWIAAVETGSGPIRISQLAWREPFGISSAMRRVFHGTVEPSHTKSDSALDTPLACMTALARWIEAGQLFRPDTFPTSATSTDVNPLNLVSPSLYLHNFPWSFVGAAWPDLIGGADRPATVAAAFSRTSAELAHQTPPPDMDASKIEMFLDPMGDLPEVAELECKWASRATIHRGLRATALRFRQAATEVPVLAFVGHGLPDSEQAASRLVFSLGQGLTADELRRGQGKFTAASRVAIVLSCWAGRPRETEHIGAWEPGGLVYALKELGFTHVVSALWPITPRAAIAFLDPFLVCLTAGERVEHAFSEAYHAVLKDLGIEQAATEGGCIQLFV